MTDDSASLRSRIEVLERRVSELSWAAVRIGAILDPDAVPQEVVDSARVLTGARRAPVGVGGAGRRDWRCARGGKQSWPTARFHPLPGGSQVMRVGRRVEVEAAEVEVDRSPTPTPATGAILPFRNCRSPTPAPYIQDSTLPTSIGDEPPCGTPP